jgi:hypothetical protein
MTANKQLLHLSHNSVTLTFTKAFASLDLNPLSPTGWVEYYVYNNKQK